MRTLTDIIFGKTLVLIFILVLANCTSVYSSQKNIEIESELIRTKNNPVINVQKFGIYGRINHSENATVKFDRWLKLKTAFEYCIKTKSDLYFPKGIYDVGERNFPFREDDLNTNVLRDCNGITIFGAGRGTLLITSSSSGADVLQLNMLKNLTIKNFDISAELSSEIESGSNGVSVTNGYDNINLENLYIYDLPGIDKTGYIDGGKGLTMQFSANRKTIKGSFKATNITVENCAYGFRFDAAHVSDLLKEKMDIVINNLIVNKAYQGFSMDFGDASENININSKLNMNVSASLTNCQQFVRFSRVIGGVYNFKVRKSDSKIESLRDNKNKLWKIDDTRLFGFLSNYSKETTISIIGDVGNVDEKIWIGAVGSIDEPFNLKNRTENNLFTFDIAGTSTNTDVKIINYKGESIHNSTINITKRTINKSHIPQEFKVNSNKVNFK
ncbi:hypothetical protein [Kaistella antarctica]|uniref:Uncharacterized protein n=1 Tax=Kaistella antarctica TaxID=266748 RepID=A0A3S4UYD9_9FLAO|nr:hypothetical protein [Kaistella antarctica]KEY18824.1 hypothetical protein HY04_10150 [Kaistella antarctica]SEW15008.1 hypothetical protein SAMN05421765_2705 [Kaistella antarctica]VEH99424.1 Uncharacterised protein [Kaistella antarctica]